MAYFSNSDAHSNPLPFEIACVYDDIFIHGLKTGEYLYSHQPHFLMAENGRVVGINASFKTFYIIDEHKVVHQRLTLNWKEDCENNEEVMLSRASYNASSSFNLEIGLSSLLLIGLVILTIRRLYGS